MAASKRNTKSKMSIRLDHEAARLAGVVEILDNLSENSNVADSLGVLQDTVDDVNEKISEMAAEVRGVEMKEARRG